MTETTWMVVHQADNAPWSVAHNLYNLTEAEADAKLATFAEVNLRKPHRQEYKKLAYAKGNLVAFASANNILIE